ncbi:hypothetical protein CDAR_315681 [Caerostris darwini]|uniref:Uncharacterized protein n=1 Tax=Caerostris darwini TaxID=1538125 RepID=A0AAV4PTS5_9ARAC|nr:hypothetical protein CDAR_315681 [Caerostris darwini]
MLLKNLSHFVLVVVFCGCNVGAQNSEDLLDEVTGSVSSSVGSVSSSLGPKSSVSAFTSTLLEKVERSDILKDVFDLSGIDSSGFINFFTKTAEKFARVQRFGVTATRLIKSTVSQIVEEYSDLLTSPNLKNVLFNSMAEYLSSEDKLNLENASSLAESTAETLEGIAKRSVRNNRPESKLKALSEGLDQFMDLAGITLEEHGPDLWLQLVNDIQSARKD